MKTVFKLPKTEEGRRMFTSMNKKQRYAVKALALLSAVAVMFVILSSLSYITEHADHRCDGEHCSVCLTIKQCFDNLKTSAGVPSCSLYIGLLLAAAVYLFAISVSDDTAVTLITQKVRLND